MSSMLLWMDYMLIKKGEAYTNHGSVFYPADSSYNGYYAYSAPFKPFVYDVSVSGPTVPTGLVLNNVNITTGTSGFVALDYRNGRAYFTTPLPSNSVLSGNYAIKEYAVELTSKSEVELLFETKLELRPKIGLPVTGLQGNQDTYPIIYLRKSYSQNKELAFGGHDDTQINVTAFVFTDSQFNLDATLGLLRDTKNTYIPMLSAAEMPFNSLGDYKNGQFNFTGITNNRPALGSGICIRDAREIQMERFSLAQSQKLNPGVYFGMVDFSLSSYRYPRQ